MGNAILTLSPQAVARLRELQKENEGQGVLKLYIGKRGCSGHSYDLEFVEGPAPLDEEIIQEGVRLIVDNKAVLFLMGTLMDYQESDLESGFTFTNPNEKGRCGCGESFAL